MEIGSRSMPRDVERQDVPWYRAAFGPAYLTVYRDRDEADARHLRLLLDTLHCSCRGMRVLDIGCGHGRHLRVVEEAGAEAYGIDLSLALLGEARRRRPEASVVVADMRTLPLRAGVFDLALSLFTSFGYFDTDRENAQVLDEARRVLKPGGRLVLDTLNAVWLRGSLVAETRRRVGSAEVLERRWIDEVRNRINKHVEITPGEHGAVDRWSESVRLWTADELAALLEGAGFKVERLAGGFGGEAFRPQDSERIILVGGRGEG